MTFLVTGSGRCGTQWMATALTRLGYRCGHEAVFNPMTLRDGSWRARMHRPDSSWLALAVLDEIDVPVIAVARHPLAVIRSLMGIRFFAEPSEYADVARFTFALPDDPLEASAWFWIEANQRALSRAAVTVRIEEPDLRAVLALIDPGRVPSERALRSVSRDLAPMNARQRDESVALDMLEPRTRKAVAEIAEQLGYRTELPLA